LLELDDTPLLGIQQSGTTEVEVGGRTVSIDALVLDLSPIDHLATPITGASGPIARIHARGKLEAKAP
jgi:hypothetical protein